MRRSSRSGFHYGDRADAYHRGRKDYPQEVLEHIVAAVDHLEEPAVDVGCGTGVSTRQLNKYWKMTGVDHDPRMLRLAQYAQRDIPPGSRDRIVYQHARADRMIRIPDASQQLVSCFAAFHNFPEGKVVREFKRVLRRDGYAVIVHQKSADGDLFRVAWTSVIAGYLGEVPKRHKDVIGYSQDSVEEMLLDGGFKRTWKRIFPGQIEEYTLDEAMAWVLPMTYWKSIPSAQHAEAEKRLRLAFEGLIPKGKQTLPRRTDAWAVIARKS